MGVPLAERVTYLGPLDRSLDSGRFDRKGKSSGRVLGKKSSQRRRDKTKKRGGEE